MEVVFRNFKERLLWVIGETPYSTWARQNKLSATTVKDWVNGVSTPNARGWENLERNTNLPISWWKEGTSLPRDWRDSPDRNHLAVNEPRKRYGSDSDSERDEEDDDYEEWADGIDRGSFVPVRYFRDAAVSAGHGAVNSDHTPEALLFSRSFLRTINARPRDLYLVKVKGDSMLPTLQAGWTVMIDASKRSVSSGIYVIRLAGQEVCKRLEARPGGVVKVISDNRLYDEYEINAASASAEEFQILGTVVWFAGVLQ